MHRKRVDMYLRPLRMPSHIRRNWLTYTVTGTCTGLAIVSAVRNKDALLAATHTIALSGEIHDDCDCDK